MSGQLTPEYRTLRINWPDVNKAISRGVDIHGYAEKLNAANLTQDVDVDVLGVKRSAIMHELSGNVAIQVHLEATKFDNYVRILESYSILSSVVRKLWHDREWYREHPEAPMDAVPPPPPPLPSPPLRSTPPPPIRDVMQKERGMAAKPGSPDPDVLLNKHDLKSLVRILRGAAHLYNELAIHLGMDADWVKNVESNTPTVQKRLIEVLSHFIGNDEHPTRRKIADALHDVDQRGLALEILGDELPGSGGDDRRRPLFNSSSHPQVPDERQPKVHVPPPDTVAVDEPPGDVRRRIFDGSSDPQDESPGDVRRRILDGSSDPQDEPPGYVRRRILDGSSDPQVPDQHIDLQAKATPASLVPNEHLAKATPASSGRFNLCQVGVFLLVISLVGAAVYVVTVYYNISESPGMLPKTSPLHSVTTEKECAAVTDGTVTFIKAETGTIQDDWYTLAEKIGLSTTQVGAIHSDLRLPQAAQKKSKAIDIWFEMSRPLETLVCALYDMEYERKANKIAQKYCGGRMSAEVCA